MEGSKLHLTRGGPHTTFILELSPKFFGGMVRGKDVWYGKERTVVGKKTWLCKFLSGKKKGKKIGALGGEGKKAIKLLRKAAGEHLEFSLDSFSS